KKIAVLNITSRCNLACGFCFGPEITPPNLPLYKGRKGGVSGWLAGRLEMTTSQAKNKILQLKKSGAKILIFTGGEPLLRLDIWELICYAKKLGFFTVLHTNGILLCKKIKNQKTKTKTTNQRQKNDNVFLNCLDQINLPLDGYNAKTNDALRGVGHFKKVMQVLKLLSSLAGQKSRSARLKNTKIRVIISTVATKKNKNWVAKIGKILPKWIYKWRIFQFNPQGKAGRVKEEFYLADEEFEEIKKEISCLSAGVQRRLGAPAKAGRNLRFSTRHQRYSFKIQCVGVEDKFWKSYNTISNF
ncbi:MAG: radical SAM protein, partial [Patescibacteria group bacterium]